MALRRIPFDTRTAILLLFFLSGATGLAYEIVWTRFITEIIGAAPYAVSIVLTVFMAGLGIGGFLGGRIADKTESPSRLLTLYGRIEIAVGAYALVLPFMFRIIRPLYAFIYNRIFDHFTIFAILTFIGCFLIMILPAVLMGATLPFLARYYSTGLPRIGTNMGLLYGINTIGGAAGALMTGFVLMSLLGTWGTLVFASAVSCAVGTTAIMIGKGMSDFSPALSRTAENAAPYASLPSFAGWTALGVFAVSGFCSMSCEVIWTRLIGLIMGPTTYSFTVVLITFITGLAIGGIIFGMVVDRVRNPIMLLMYTQAPAALCIITASQLMGDSQMFFARLIFALRNHIIILLAAKTIILFVLMVLPTVLFGAAFPIVVRIFARSNAMVGRSVGTAYAFNTIGTVLGSFLAGYVIIPWLGKAHALSLISSIQLMGVLGAATVFFLKGGCKKEECLFAGSLVFLGLAADLEYPRWNTAMLSVGKYHRSYDLPSKTGIGWITTFFYGPRIFSRFERGEILYTHDGAAGFTTVRKNAMVDGSEEISLFNSGKSDASTGGGDMCTQTMLAHFPLIHHPSPEKVLVIGLASGITAGETLNYPVKHLDIVDINPAMAEASSFFAKWNGNVLDDSRTNLIVQDGRAHLTLTDKRYDVIISEPSNPWMAGIASLFTRRFFELARDRLTEDGICVQWIQGYQIDWKNFALIGRTFTHVFPASVLVATGNGADYLLIGYRSGKLPDKSIPAANLRYAAQSSNVTIADHRVFSRFVITEDPAGFFGDGPVNTDTMPRLEYAAPKFMNSYDPLIHTNMEAKRMLNPDTENDERFMRNDPDGRAAFAAYILSFDGLYAKYPEIGTAIEGPSAASDRYADTLIEYSRRTYIPDFSFIADDSLRSRCKTEQIDGLSERIDLASANETILFHLGKLSYETDRYTQSKDFYSKALELDEKAKTAHYNIGIVLVTEGKLPEAIEEFNKEIEIDPSNLSAYNSLGNTLYLSGKTDEALKSYSKALDIAPDFYKAHMNMGKILTEMGKTEEGAAHLREAERLKRKDEGIFK